MVDTQLGGELLPTLELVPEQLLHLSIKIYGFRYQDVLHRKVCQSYEINIVHTFYFMDKEATATASNYVCLFVFNTQVFCRFFFYHFGFKIRFFIGSYYFCSGIVVCFWNVFFEENLAF